jgi:hypothetical protein
VGGERLTAPRVSTGRRSLFGVMSAMFWSVRLGWTATATLPRDVACIAIRLSRPQRQLIVPRGKSGRDHDEVSELNLRSLDHKTRRCAIIPHRRPAQPCQR